MTLVTKVIKGNSYYYFQDSAIGPDSKNHIVTTCIGRTTLNSEKLLNKREEALIKHFTKLYKATSLIKKVPYRFEHKPTKKNNDHLEYIKILYQQFKNNLLLPYQREDFEKTFFVKYVYGTTAIEGNTLTEGEADKLLSTGLTSNNKTLNETLEVANYNDVKQFMDTYREDISERLVRQIHRLLMKGVIGNDGLPIKAGEYRTNAAKITGVWFKPVSPEQISLRIRYLLMEHKERQANDVHPVEVASIFHQKFEEIHPFQEGNGRTGREILNHMLTRNGFPPIYITHNQRSDYLNALEEGNRSEYVPLLDFIINRMAGTLTYLVSKTNLFHMITTDSYKQYFVSIGDEELYDKYIKKMEQFNKSEELP